MSKQQDHEEQLPGSDGLLQAALGQHHGQDGRGGRQGVPILSPRLSHKHGLIFWLSGRGNKMSLIMSLIVLSTNASLDPFEIGLMSYIIMYIYPIVMNVIVLSRKISHMYV